MVGLDGGAYGSRFARAAFTPEQSGNWGNVYVDPKAAAATLKLTTSSQPPSASDRAVSGKIWLLSSSSPLYHNLRLRAIAR